MPFQMRVKKSALAIMLTVPTIGVAVAADQVEIFGIVDVGYMGQTTKTTNPVTGVSTSAKITAIDSGRLYTSRIGFRGNEDLGGGLKAVFRLEYGLEVDQNSGIGSGANPNRQSYVGLEGSFGEIIAGRLESAGKDFACRTSPIAGTVMDAHTVGVRSLLNCVGAGRLNNAIGYTSPRIGGFEVSLNHSFAPNSSEGANTASANNTGEDDKAQVIGIDYKNGALSAGAAYGKYARNNSKADDDTTEMGIRVRYDFPMVNVYGSYQTLKTGPQDDADSKYSIAVVIPVSAAGRVIAQYANADLNPLIPVTAPVVAKERADSRAWYLAYTHALSKRTMLYAGYQIYNTDAVNQVGNRVDATNRKTTIAGIRHNF